MSSIPPRMLAHGQPQRRIRRLRPRRLGRVALLLAAFACAPRLVAADPAPTFVTLHVFPTSQGSRPDGLLKAADGNLYGITVLGGRFGVGTLYRVAADGSVTVLHDFGEAAAAPQLPRGALIQASDGLLYGVTNAGGRAGAGTVYRYGLDGSFTVVHEFDGAAGGGVPLSALVQASDGGLYGTTQRGGTAASNGTVYRLSLGGDFSVVHAFEEHDGHAPQAPLIEGDDHRLYGTTWGGGANDLGTVFRTSLDGSESIVHSFAGADGSHPGVALVQARDGRLFGTTGQGGDDDRGVLFVLKPQGAFAKLHDFHVDGPDGAIPSSSLLDAGDGTLIGTTESGGRFLFGTVFRYGAAHGLEILHDFHGAKSGAFPTSALVFTGPHRLNGVAGSSRGDIGGTVYALGEKAHQLSTVAHERATTARGPRDPDDAPLLVPPRPGPGLARGAQGKR